MNKIPQRKKFYVAVEGASERGFIAWLNLLCNSSGLHLSLDSEDLQGGSYERMLSQAVKMRRKRDRSNAKASILIVDSDVAARQELWSVNELREKATMEGFVVCFQNPNHESLLFRLHAGNQRKSQTNDATVQLKRIWPEYEKGLSANTLNKRFTIEDLRRTAAFDEELRLLLDIVSLL